MATEGGGGGGEEDVEMDVVRLQYWIVVCTFFYRFNGSPFGPQVSLAALAVASEEDTDSQLTDVLKYCPSEMDDVATIMSGVLAVLQPDVGSDEAIQSGSPNVFFASAPPLRSRSGKQTGLPVGQQPSDNSCFTPPPFGSARVRCCVKQGFENLGHGSADVERVLHAESLIDTFLIRST
ncbi:Protein of unknown function [Gryllus bimaculatus]|nr:Protein of unknown function [Gryllus bimaculatus]